MSTTHEYDAYCEMKEAHEAALKRQGAMDALKELKLYLLHCGCHPELKAEVNGIVWSLNAIKRRLDDLELTPEVGGTLPPGYLENIVAEGGVA